MKLTVTVFAQGAQDYEEDPAMENVEFDMVKSWEIIDDFFIVNMVEGTLQAIKKYKIQKFFTSN